MVSILLNPWMDAVLRAHVVRAAKAKALPVADLEDLIHSEAEAIEWLKECGVETYLSYLEAASAAVDHIGWVVTPRRRAADPVK